MRRFSGLVLLAIMALSTAAFSQTGETRRKADASELELRERQLDIAEREMKLDFQRQMQQLKLEEAKQGLDRKRQARDWPKRHRACGFVFFALCCVVNILLTVWVFQDLRARNSGSGIWVVVTLLAGFLGALLYVLVRLGDIRQTKMS